LNKKHAALGFERDSPKSEDEKSYQKRDDPLAPLLRVESLEEMILWLPSSGSSHSGQVVPLNSAYATINGQKKLIDECVYMFWML